MPDTPAPEDRIRLEPGDRVPTFRARTRTNPHYVFDSAAGRWIVLGCIGSAGVPQLAEAARRMVACPRFNDRFASLFLISADPEDYARERLLDRVPGVRVFWDEGLGVSRLLGAAAKNGGEQASYAPQWLILDPALTVRARIPIRSDLGCVDEVTAYLEAAEEPSNYMGFAVPAPVLILPDVFEPAFCDRLIREYDDQGGAPSGVMRERDGRTVGVQDTRFKVRSDVTLSDEALVDATRQRIRRKVVPQIARVHFFQVTRMERYMVGAYSAEDGGHFSPHRDNTTSGTAHRRFAVSINLNDGFDGGEVSFPEYGPTGYKAPRGGAVIFSCALLHAVSRVTRGTRYAFLPFLYDEAAARLRAENAARQAAAEAGAAPAGPA